MAEQKDRTIGGFRVLAEIQAGSGAQGTVYKAVCDKDVHGLVSPGTLVALKVMPVQDQGQSQWRRLEKRTAELASLRHPNVVQYYGCFAEQGAFNDVHVVVQEFLDGETLKERLARQTGGLDVDEAIRIVSAALDGLAYTSKSGIVHRDLKPGNIFLCRDGSVKLIDFEIAKKEGGTVTTAGGNIRGSFDYMAPDFTNPEFHGDERSDVFSMGVVLHEALTGKLPYQKIDCDDRQVHFAFLARWAAQGSRGSGSPIHISSRIRRLLAHTEEVLARALAPKREERYPDFKSFRDGIGKVRFRNLHNGPFDYQMLRFVGKGGFGEVFKARIKQTGQIVAVKHLLKDEYAERFRREAKIMKKLASPYFVRFVDFFEQEISGNRESFLAMAFLDGMPGSSLRDAIKRGDGVPLDAKSVLLAFGRYARGLHAMHNSGIFHRDIKPSNLYYPEGCPERAAIMDFGIARDVHGTATSGQVPGTLDYMPPEVVLTDSRGDAGMDVYALGLCLYEALSGKTAYPRLPSGTAGYAAFFQRSKNGTTPSFSALDETKFATVHSLLMEMTDVDPSRRICDAGKVAERISDILRERFGSDIVPVDVPADPETSDATMTLTPTVPATVVQDSPTRGTAATQTLNPQFGEMIDDERRAIAKRRFWSAVSKVAAALALVASAGAGVYFGWPQVDRLLKLADAQERIPPATVSPVESNPEPLPKSLKGGAKAETPPKSAEPSPERPKDDPYAEMRIKVASQCFALINKLEPVETRRERIDEARNLMEENSVNGIIDDVFAKNLAEKIDERRKWVVGVVSNATDRSVAVAGRTISAGGAELFKFESGLPDKWSCSAEGYDDVPLKRDFDGRTLVVSGEDLIPRVVTMGFPRLDKGVECIYGRRSVVGALSLRPGLYECRYTRPGYVDQLVPFSVEFNRDGELPAPGEWKAKPVKVKCPPVASDVKRKVDGVETDQDEIMLDPGEHVCEYLRTDFETQRIPFAVEVMKERSLPACREWKESAALLERRERERRKELENRLEAFEREFEGLCSDEPIGTRKARLDAAMERVKQELDDGVLSQERAEAMRRRVADRKVWIVCRVANDTPTEIAVAGRAIAPSKGELFVFKDGLPHEWSVGAPGYEDMQLAKEVDGQTISISSGNLVPRAVNMALPQMENGARCFFNGSQVSGPLSLRPGRYSIRYTKAGCEDQNIGFEVFVGKDGLLPRPGTWSVKPVNVRFRFPGAGIVCKVDGKTVDRDVPLPPGGHECRYERDDYLPQTVEFKVEVGVERELPACGSEWVEGEGLKALNEAEALAKNGEWLHVEEKLGMAEVKSPLNIERRSRLYKESRKQVEMQKKLRQAEAYFQSEEYYEYVKAYHEVFRDGYVLSDVEKSSIKSKCMLQIESLTKQISHYEEQIRIGRSFVRDVEDMKAKRKNLIDWRIELTGE